MVIQNLSSGEFYNPSILLDLAAADDVEGFRSAVESGARLPINGSGLWYGSRVGSRKMGYEERTPLMVAALYGSTNVLRYILAGVEADPNRIAGSDGVSALHLAVAGGSSTTPAAVQILLDASANPNLLNANRLKPSDLIPKSPNSKKLKVLLGAATTAEDADPVSPKSEGGYGGAPLPDINTGVYSSDEFRMYSFKIKPCSRAYTHDWTECPFAHPGENARRRDPVRHPYSCVPCPEFKKGSCRKGDDCEFAHGVFESWLHPAQYRTRLCKDETGCSRKVCFFAHRKDELRPVYASTGSALPGSMDPISPSSSPKWGSAAKVSCSALPPTLQLPGGSRLRSSSSARDVDLEIELLKTQIAHQNQLNLKPANLDSVFGLAMSPSPMSLSQLRNSYPVHSRKLSPTEFDSSPKSVAAAMLNSRAAATATAFAKRSQSFLDRGAATGSPVGGAGCLNYGPNYGRRVDWSVQGDDLSKLRRSASFGIRGGGNVSHPRYGSAGFGGGSRMEEPDVSWVSSLLKDVAPPCSPWVDQVCT